jgi:hypothetical protein
MRIMSFDSSEGEFAYAATWSAYSVCDVEGLMLCRPERRHIKQHVERGEGTALIEQNMESAAFSASSAHQTTQTSP